MKRVAPDRNYVGNNNCLVKEIKLQQFLPSELLK